MAAPFLFVSMCIWDQVLDSLTRAGAEEDRNIARRNIREEDRGIPGELHPRTAKVR